MARQKRPRSEPVYEFLPPKEATRASISVESYLHVRTNRELLHRLRRIVKGENEKLAAEKDPKKAEWMNALWQASWD